MEYAVVVRRLLLAVFTGLSAGVLAALAPACTGESGDPDAEQNAVGSGGAGKLDGGGGAGGGGGSSSTSDAGGAGQKSPVIVSVVANGLVTEGQSETLSDLVEAELVAYAAGARGAHLAWEWRDSDPQGPAGATEAAAFAAHGARAKQLGREPILELLVADALRDLKPSSLAGLAWDDASVVSGLEATIDAALVAYEGQLRTIALGRDVNAYVDDHPLERDALTDLLEAGATYATSHPLAPAGLVVGVGLRAVDVVSQPSVDKELLVTGTAAVFSYVPGYDGFVGTDDPAYVAADLDAMVALAAARPVVLLTGYPSAGETGSSEASQLAFYGALFEALEPRRQAFHAVSALRLYDVPEGVCATELADLGYEPDAPYGATWCSLGLRRADDDVKPAWSAVLVGLSTFASP